VHVILFTLTYTSVYKSGLKKKGVQSTCAE